MNDYYIKIKQNQSEIEFATSDRVEFNQRLQELMQLAGALDKISIPTPAKQEEEVKPAEEEKSEFEQVLEKSLQHPIEQVSPNFSADRSFKGLFLKASIDNVVDRIVFTAGYMAEFEDKELFTLKELNRKLFPIVNEAVAHADINTARMNGLVTVMPNCADRTALTQYILTEKGEARYNELGAR